MILLKAPLVDMSSEKCSQMYHISGFAEMKTE